MAVFHVVEKEYPTVAVRTTKNRRSAEYLLSFFGEGYDIIEDLCGGVREKQVDILTELSYKIREELGVERCRSR